MKLYQYPKCSTCRQAIKFLTNKGIEFKSIDITLHPPTKTELRVMLASYEGQIQKLFNTSGMQYRELNMKQKLPGMSSSEAIDLLAGNGKLIKRPFLIRGNDGHNAQEQGVVGFKESDWQAFFRA